MQTDQQSSPARLAAIVALIAAFVVVVALAATSLGGEDSSEPSRSGSTRQERRAQNQAERGERRVYVVKPGDCCLSQIAERTGVDVDTLVELNPNLDPQAIHSGDRVKLR